MRSEDKYSGEEDVGFFDLMVSLFARKTLVAGIAFLAIIVSMAYVFLKQPIYEAKLFIHPPSQNDISSLNYGRGESSGLRMLGIEDVYAVFVQTLQSESARYDYFRAVVVPALGDDQSKGFTSEMFKSFNKTLTVAMPSKDSPQVYVVTLEHSDPEKAARWVSEFVALVAQRASREIIKSVQSDAELKANNLDQQVSSGQESARNQREDRIARLTEALAIARSIGMERPVRFFGPTANGRPSEADGVLAYMRGTRALEAEIQNLQERPSDDPFIGDLRHKQSLSKFYRQLKIDPAGISVYRQDGNIELPHEPVKPRAALIILLGGVIGLIVGILIAVILDFLDVRASKREESFADQR
ncbi:hypothetical protein AUC61_12575 [Pseudomonas sp. S25]|uniref:Polysaccharide chain length determinant N-terminal domain-containing protein n=1 Tax=Pseudomonas maioricensis TaxID=1766623 RepID=A0ABS9ZIJ9_9PSED|nr:Wzz/FepE/Etk N-terminal domain-containing protein [Pseudomonas sp. S25]MCI8210373.1 hypothetical protein [Pseudomonas sp. S25]